MSKTTTVFSKTYTSGWFISVIIGGYGGGNAPFEVLVEFENECYVLVEGELIINLAGDGWCTFGKVQEIIDILEAKP